MLGRTTVFYGEEHSIDIDKNIFLQMSLEIINSVKSCFISEQVYTFFIDYLISICLNFD